MFEIRFTGATEKYLKKIKENDLKKAFQVALNEISCDPYIGELKTGDLAGTIKINSHLIKDDYLSLFITTMLKEWLHFYHSPTNLIFNIIMVIINKKILPLSWKSINSSI